jgi:uncharacterized protein YjiS (DUF1127 family)
MIKEYALMQCVGILAAPSAPVPYAPGHSQPIVMPHVGTQPASGFGKIADTLSSWRQRAQQRRQLRNLNEQRLLDIGVDPVGAAREWRKPFWRA